MITVRKVETKKDWKDFIDLPFKLYKNDKNWVPPLKKDMLFKLDTERHPFWEHAIREVFLAEKDGQIVGRIGAVIDFNYNELWDEHMGAFGFFECINDEKVSHALFDAAYNWLKKHKAEKMRGPLSPSQNDECAFLLEGYDSPPVMMMPYNPPYYLTLTEKYGMKKGKDLYAFFKSHTTPPSPQIQTAVDRLKRNPSISTRHVNLKQMKEEAHIIKELYNESWQKNWGFSPMTDKEFDLMVEELAKIADDHLVWFAYYKDDPAGVSITLPDYNPVFKKLKGTLGPISIIKFLYYRRKIVGTRAIVFGFRQKYRRFGLPALLYHETEQAGLKRGYEWCELSWNLEDNDLINQFDEKVGGKIYKKYRIYEMPIS